MGCEKETEWGWLELTEEDRRGWQKLRVPSASRVSTRMSQGCGRSRSKNMEKAGRTLDAQLWNIKRAEYSEMHILLLLTEGVGWTASHFLRWMDGSEAWRVLCSGRACAADPQDSTSTKACCENILYLMKYESSYMKILPGDLTGGGTYSKPLPMSPNLESTPFHWHPELKWRQPEKRKCDERKHGRMDWTEVFLVSSVDSSPRQVIPMGSNQGHSPPVFCNLTAGSHLSPPPAPPSSWALYIKTANRRAWGSAYLNDLH